MIKVILVGLGIGFMACVLAGLLLLPRLKAMNRGHRPTPGAHETQVENKCKRD